MFYICHTFLEFHILRKAIDWVIWTFHFIKWVKNCFFIFLFNYLIYILSILKRTEFSYWKVPSVDLKIEGANKTQKMEFSVKDFSSKCDQIRIFLRIWSHLLKKSLMENFIFCAGVSRLSSFLWICSHVHPVLWATLFATQPQCCLIFECIKLQTLLTQPVFTCSKLTKETLEQGVTYVQS